MTQFTCHGNDILLLSYMLGLATFAEQLFCVASGGLQNAPLCFYMSVSGCQMGNLLLGLCLHFNNAQVDLQQQMHSCGKTSKLHSTPISRKQCQTTMQTTHKIEHIQQIRTQLPVF